MTSATDTAPVSPLRTLYRRIYWWPRDRVALRPLHGVRTVVAFGESLGDNLLCTNVLAGLHATGAGPLAMLTPYPELFANLPFQVRCLPFDLGVIGALMRGGPRLVLPTYGRYDRALDRHVPSPRDHLIAELCRSAGVPIPTELKPLVVLTAAERQAGLARSHDFILVQSSNCGARMPAGNKDWPIERWQAVVNALRARHPVAQIGASSDPALSGVSDWRGKLSLRELAGALSAARLYLGGEGFLMHLARGVECRAVIVLGGRTQAAQTCYAENENLATSPSCSPCWQMNTCAYGRRCLMEIAPATVLEAAERQLARKADGAHR